MLGGWIFFKVWPFSKSQLVYTYDFDEFDLALLDAKRPLVDSPTVPKLCCGIGIYSYLFSIFRCAPYGQNRPSYEIYETL